MVKLFNVTTTIKKFRGHKDVYPCQPGPFRFEYGRDQSDPIDEDPGTVQLRAELEALRKTSRH